MLYIKKMTLNEAEQLVAAGVLVRLASYRNEKDARLCLLSYNDYGDDDIIEIVDKDVIHRYRPR